MGLKLLKTQKSWNIMKYKLNFVKISDAHEFAGVGFAGNIFLILNALTHIDETDEMYVNMETYECACTDKTVTNFKTQNCWEYYFNQTPNQNIQKDIDIFMSANIDYEDRNIFLYPENFISLQEKFWKNFSLKQEIEESINKFYEKNIKNKTTLGVQIRLTDMKHHHNVSSVQKYVDKIKQILIDIPEIKQIFLSTDDSEVITILKENLSIPVIFYENMFRASKEMPHINPYDRFYDDRLNHRYLLGKECCQEIFTLSKCDFLLKADVSSISIVACILSEKIRKVFKL
jgi:hypothetical protein